MKFDTARKTVLALSAAMLLFSATAASALPLIGFNVRGGQYTDVEEWFLGGGVDFDVLMLKGSPNFEYVFIDGRKLYTLNLDVSFTVLPLAAGSVWVGGGYVSSWTQIDGRDTNQNSGINLLVGGGLGLIPLKPFAQFKYSRVNDNNEYIWMLGARF
jgi:hypothetical protein